MIEKFEKTIAQYKQYYISLEQLEILKIQYKMICKKTHNKQFQRQYKNLEKLVNEWNQIFLKNEDTKVSDLLDHVKGYPLDQEQRQVVLSEEQNTLVIAGAGSGKSLTMIGKIRYLVEYKKVPLDQILCISFTNDATNSLKNTLKQYYNYDLPVLTFHKLALKILYHHKLNLTIADANTLNKIVENYFETTILEEQDAQNWILKHFFHKNKGKIDVKVCKKQSFPQIYSKIKNSNQVKMYTKIIPTFIRLMKANQIKITALDQWILQSKFFHKWSSSDTYFLMLMKRLYIHYQKYLADNHQMDFDDVIDYAIAFLDKDKIFTYKYILIDEYQDTSKMRYELIKAIIKQTNAKLIAVGDDFQSIYRFTGCNLDIFLKFKLYFPNARLFKIQTTYRNSQELINVAGSFVMRNPRQMSKQLVSSKTISKPIHIIYYQNFILELKKLLNQLEYTQVYLLGRNHRDINPILKDSDFTSMDERKIRYKLRNDLDITFLTVHASKGLESDLVIILNMANDVLGFPSKLEDDPILKYVNPNQDFYPYEEERRLFYVALTRTKNVVYLMTPKKNPSFFIQELLHKNRRHILLQSK